MVKHNNVIPNVHLRKHWQKNVRVWLNQAARKKRRLTARRAKAAAIAPRPLDRLRPLVNCTTIRYNHRQRAGRGFTLQEIKAAGLGVSFARSIGISVDHRRKNRSQESLDRNKQRLTQFVNNLVLFPLNEKKPVTKAKAGILNDTAKVNILLFRTIKRSIQVLWSTPKPDLLGELSPSEVLFLTVSRRPKCTGQLDRSGTTKEMKERG